MKLLSFFMCFQLTASFQFWDNFVEFTQKFKKDYSSFEELEVRFQIFRSNFHNIMKHNSIVDSSIHYKLGVNSFSDLTPEEFKSQYVGGFKKRLFANATASSCGSFSASASRQDLPIEIDWRTKNAVTPVKNQGQCGSCWSFSATGAMEGRWSIHSGELVSLSEQQLVDCSTRYGNMGCNGGMMDDAFRYVIDNGICGESAYPYTATSSKRQHCNVCETVATLSSCLDVPENNQLSLKEAVSMGPVSVAIEADTKVFQSYSTGVITSPSCGTNLDHGVLIVGYGEETGIPFWLVKNSWGPDWGEDGYIKIMRNDTATDGGICGIAMQPSFPVV